MESKFSSAPQAAQPLLLSASHLSRAVADPRFFALVPEFMPIQAKAKVMRVDVNSNRGCSKCAQRRVGSTLFRDFTSIALALSPDGRARFKSYLGATSIVVNTVQPDGHVKVVQL